MDAYKASGGMKYSKSCLRKLKLLRHYLHLNDSENVDHQVAVDNDDTVETDESHTVDVADDGVDDNVDTHGVVDVGCSAAVDYFVTTALGGKIVAHLVQNDTNFLLTLDAAPSSDV